MKNKTAVYTSVGLCCIIAAIIVSCALTGCVSVQSTAGKMLASTALTVDASMKGWAQWVVAGQANADQETKVKAAYIKYQAAMNIAKNAYAELAANPSNQTGWQTASEILTNNRDALLALISSFQTPAKP